MPKEILKSRSGKITVKFAENFNKKLYGKYFTTVRECNYPINKNDLVEIVLDDKPIMLARVVECDLLYFHELGKVFIQCDTGMCYSDSLELFKKFGINVNDFDTKVKCILFECEQVYSNGKTKT